MHGMVYENMRSGGALRRKQKEDTNGYQRSERMCTPDKSPIWEEQPGQEQLLHEEHLHIQNMGVMMFLEGMLWGAMYRASSDGSKTRNGDGYYRYEAKLSSKITTWRSMRQIRNFWHYEMKFRMQQRKICGLAGNVARIRKIFRRCINPIQMNATISVDNESKEWCLQNGIKKVTTWNGRTKAYGKMNTRKYNRSHCRIPRTRCTTRKDIPDPERTRKNNVVLGMPWLENENPRINWNEMLQLRKTVQEKSSTGTEDDGKTSVHRFE